MVRDNHHASSLETSCASTSQSDSHSLKRLMKHMNEGNERVNVSTHTQGSGGTLEFSPFRSTTLITKNDPMEAQWQTYRKQRETTMPTTSWSMTTMAVSSSSSTRTNRQNQSTTTGTAMPLDRLAATMTDDVPPFISLSMSTLNKEEEREGEEGEGEFSEAWNNETMTREFLSNHHVPSGELIEWGEPSNGHYETSSPALTSSVLNNDAYSVYDITNKGQRSILRHAPQNERELFNVAWSDASHNKPLPSSSSSSSMPLSRSCYSAANWTSDFLQQEQHQSSSSQAHSMISTMATELSEAAQVVMNANAGLATRQWEWRWEKYFGKSMEQLDELNMNDYSNDDNGLLSVDITTDVIMQRSRRRLEQLLLQFKSTQDPA